MGFTIPKRLRIFFRYDRRLLGKLCRAAWKTVRDLYELEVDGTCGTSCYDWSDTDFWTDILKVKWIKNCDSFLI